MHYGSTKYSYPQFNLYVAGIVRRAEPVSSIKCMVACGSLSRKEWTPTSDLDVRIVRFPGYVNGLRACWFLMEERTRAMIAKFLLDIYLIDDKSSLQKLNLQEQPIILYSHKHQADTNSPSI